MILYSKRWIVFVEKLLPAFVDCFIRVSPFFPTFINIHPVVEDTLGVEIAKLIKNSLCCLSGCIFGNLTFHVVSFSG